MPKVTVSRITPIVYGNRLKVEGAVDDAAVIVDVDKAAVDAAPTKADKLIIIGRAIRDEVVLQRETNPYWELLGEYNVTIPGGAPGGGGGAD